jgi:hypothetical protein
MESIFVQNHKINLNFETQISKNGRPFRLSGISLVTTKPAVWVKELKAYRHGTIYTFKYLDSYDEFFGFEFDAFNKFIQKI